MNMFGGIDPKKMQAMMKQMGIKQDEIDAMRVVIEKSDGNKIVIENPNVVKIMMQGQESWQITGEAREEDGGVSEEDVRLIMEKTGKPHPKIHELLPLAFLVREKWSEEEKDLLETLSEFAIAARYDDPTWAEKQATSENVELWLRRTDEFLSSFLV